MSNKYYLTDKQLDYVLDMHNVAFRSGRDIGNAIVNPSIAKTISCRGAVDQRADVTNFIIDNLDSEIKVKDLKEIIKKSRELHKNKLQRCDVKEPLICASRGRPIDNPNSRKKGLPTKQRLEINTSGCSNCLTTVQKDNYVIEPKLDYICSLSDKDRVGDGKHLSRNSPSGYRVYSMEGISTTISAIGGGKGGSSGLYMEKYIEK